MRETKGPANEIFLNIIQRQRTRVGAFNTHRNTCFVLYPFLLALAQAIPASHHLLLLSTSPTYRSRTVLRSDNKVQPYPKATTRFHLGTHDYSHPTGTSPRTLACIYTFGTHSIYDAANSRYFACKPCASQLTPPQVDIGFWYLSRQPPPTHSPHSDRKSRPKENPCRLQYCVTGTVLTDEIFVMSKKIIATINSTGRQSASFIRVASAVGWHVRAQVRANEGLVAKSLRRYQMSN